MTTVTGTHRSILDKLLANTGTADLNVYRNVCKIHLNGAERKMKDSKEEKEKQDLQNDIAITRHVMAAIDKIEELRGHR